LARQGYDKKNYKNIYEKTQGADKKYRDVTIRVDRRAFREELIIDMVDELLKIFDLLICLVIT
jgi:hypothetical protein